MMADISYTPKFKHTDWIDGESIVQASGDNGMNIRFRGCEQEFAAIATTFGVVDTTIGNLQQLRFLTAQQNVSVQPNASSDEKLVDSYDTTAQPAKVDKIYFCLIFPLNGLNILHTFLYHQDAPNKVRVTVAFFNPTSTAVSFNYRILALGGPSS
jgi:hypothetical protein